MRAGPTVWRPRRDGGRAAWDGIADYLGALARRTRPGYVVLSALAMSVLAALVTTGIATAAVVNAPRNALLARAVEYIVLGIVIVVGILAADEAVERGQPRGATYAVAIVVSALLGAWLGWEVVKALGLNIPPPGFKHVFHPLHALLHRLDLALIGIVVGGLTTFVHVNRRTAIAARRRQHESEQARAHARRRTLESELQALQARVEPMFLFGTLARIRRLYRSDVAAAGAMLEDLIVYLRAALPHLRESSSTLGQEATLARAWLDIVGRSDPAWNVAFDLAPGAEDASLPALVLLPLVQQAVAGAEGGKLSLGLAAKREAGRLSIEVATTTAGFARGIAGEPILEQIAARLHALYGNAARFDLEGPDDAGRSVARIEIPQEPGAADDGAES